jgi:hypothetical protein
VNTIVAVGTAILLVIVLTGIHDLQSRAERWDYNRHFED